MRFRTKTLEIANYLRMGIHSYRDRLLVQSSFWIAAILVGVASVVFNWFIVDVQAFHARWYAAHPIAMALVTPVFFLLSTAVVKVFAPHAGGSGVPQVLHAAALSNEGNRSVVPDGLLSIRTALVKVASTGFGFLGGASIGGEGPTVQISGSIFATIGHALRKRFPQLDFHSYLVAAGGAGIAAAFNTPLGGVVFALEEVAVGDFGEFRHLVMLAVIVAGLTAQALVGDALYLGEPKIRTNGAMVIGWAILIGVLGGALGGIFGRIVSSERIHRWQANWWTRALVFGGVVAIITALFEGKTAGSGYLVTRDFIEAKRVDLPLLFPLGKLLATAFSSLSGMGGGILAPSLSIGAWMGISTGKIAQFSDLNLCALLGMVAYFTGAFAIPMTAVVVVMEMTNEHGVVFPMMITALTAFIVARAIMPVPLYHVLIRRSFHKETLAD